MEAIGFIVPVKSAGIGCESSLFSESGGSGVDRIITIGESRDWRKEFHKV